MTDRSALGRLAPRGPLRMVAALAVLVVILAGCTPADEIGPMSTRVRTWVRSTQMGQDVGTVLGDAARVSNAVADRRGTSILHTDCLVLLDDAGDAVDQLPTPDGRLTTLLSNGYENEAEAATDCYDAGSQNATLLARSARERAKGRTLLEQALVRAEAIGGRSIPTTTTTQPGGGGIFG